MTSTIKVNTVTTESGSTLTLGESGKTVTLASGASQTGFGRTGTVDWQTGSIKTGDFTGANGEGYFINTTGGEVTMTLPSATAGDIISIQDYNNTFDQNSFTIQAGSGIKINGGTAAGSLSLNTEGQGLTLVFIDSTVGWRSIESTTFNTQSSLPAFVAATGGTVTTVCTNFKVHTFTGPGTFCVSCAGNGSGSNTVSYTVVAGGGSGGTDNSGGGGGGGFRESKAATDSYTASPLNATSGPTYNLPVTATAFPITVGGGGASVGPTSTKGNAGSTSTFSTITSAGGGGGGAYPGVSPSTGNGDAGGSGGGGFIGPAPSGPPTSNTGAAGNTPPVSPPQGQPGGTGKYEPQGNSGGGGGGATAAGGDSTASSSPGQQAGGGGTGATTSITASSVGYAGGGGGGAGASCLGGNGSSCLSGGYGGGNPGKPAGGRTGAPPTQPSESTAAGATNKGGGGGGSNSGISGAGGSGVVIIRYKFQ